KTYKVKVFRDKSALTLQRPIAYYVPVTKPDVIERLKLHGIQMEVLKESQTICVQMCRLIDAKLAADPFEGHQMPTVSVVKWEGRDEIFPAGSVRVPTDQPLGNLAMIMLEPQSSDSLLAWGFFPEIFQRTEYIEGYAIAKAGELMLAHDPALKAEFEQKVGSDEKFAKDPEARLRWFYERSPYYDQRYLLYPIGIDR
ncbi:MAG: carboxypeptidase, partial [Verrucomicrobia bacterium]|nr:carboxypeptidase [Verrucomicrobiota bacterium]